MEFDAFSGLGDEYKEYKMIQPDQLNFRPASNDPERRTAASLSKKTNKDAITLFIIGAVLIILGVVIMIGKQIGGIGMVLFGVLPIVLGVIKNKQGKASNLVATGTVLKKDRYATGMVSNHTKNTFRWLVISVDDMEKTLCTVHVRAEDYDFVNEGDRVLVVNDSSTFFAKKMM